MLCGGVCLAVAAVLLRFGWARRERPLDVREMRILRRFSEERRREQIFPFE
jgi:hypothetical protein